MKTQALFQLVVLGGAVLALTPACGAKAGEAGATTSGGTVTGESSDGGAKADAGPDLGGGGGVQGW